jgi:hypothetical protein
MAITGSPKKMCSCCRGIHQRDGISLWLDFPKLFLKYFSLHAISAYGTTHFPFILQYVLETRAELGADECEGEHLLEELLLTHSLWMPSNRLCDALKVYYATGALGTPHQLDFAAGDPHSAMAHRTTAKRRCVHFVMAWHTILGDRFFLDPVANSFVEELYSCLLEDAQMEEMNGGGGGGGSKLGTVLAQMQLLMGQREQTMQRLY